MIEIKLNIGCGNDIKKGFINIDREMDNMGMVDKIIDFNRDNITNHFTSNSIDYIYCSHILEHIINPYDFIMGCHKLLKKNGILEIKLPTTLRSSLGHLRTGHTKGYFYCITHGNKNGLDTKNLFEIKIKGNYKHYKFKEYLYQRYSNFRDWVLRQIYDEYIYILKKR